MDNTRNRLFDKSLKASKTGTKKIVRVKTNIGPGPITETQIIQYKRFWQKLLAEL